MRRSTMFIALAGLTLGACSSSEFSAIEDTGGNDGAGGSGGGGGTATLDASDADAGGAGGGGGAAGSDGGSESAAAVDGSGGSDGVPDASGEEPVPDAAVEADADAGGSTGTDACVPDKCSAHLYQCGVMANGCGSTVTCGPLEERITTYDSCCGGMYPYAWACGGAPTVPKGPAPYPTCVHMPQPCVPSGTLPWPATQFGWCCAELY